MTFYRPHARLQTPVGEHSLAKQSAKDECDINKILKTYERTGVITHGNAQEGRYEDLPSPVEYQEAMNQVIAAQEAFAALPAHIRARYGNDPATLLRAFEDPAEWPELQRLGLLTVSEGGGQVHDGLSGGQGGAREASAPQTASPTTG